MDPHCGDSSQTTGCDCLKAQESTPSSQSSIQIHTDGSSAPCTCWQKVNEKLAPLNVKMSEKLRAFSFDGALSLGMIHVLPLEALTGKLTRSMVQTISMSHCPFCGTKYPTLTKAEELTL